MCVLSKERADRLKVWDEISEACERDELIEGTITSRVKGGLSVTIKGGVKAFLPGSQVDLRPVRNLDAFLGNKHQFKVIKFNKRRGNIVLSRRVLLEKERAALKESTLERLKEGQIAEGIVKNLTEYGAFIDLGGIDGLLHITDMERDVAVKILHEHLVSDRDAVRRFMREARAVARLSHPNIVVMYALGEVDDRVPFMVSSVVSTLVVNGCPGQTICAPEDPEFDTVNQIQQRDYFSPSGVVGIQYDALERLRFGASFQLPFRVSGAGELSVRLPTSGFFADATVEGDEATLDFTLPPIARFGVEFDVTERVAVEVGATLEFWSVHDTLAAKPENVRIENTPGVGSFEIGVLDVAREFEDTVSVNLGIEAQPVASLPLTVSAGYAYETGAAPDEYLTVMKTNIELGLGAELPQLQNQCVTLAPKSCVASQCRAL